MQNEITPQFEQAAFNEFTTVMGNEALAAFRELVEMYRPTMATFQAVAWLKLTDNDREIFRAVAVRLWKENEAELPV